MRTPRFLLGLVLLLAPLAVSAQDEYKKAVEFMKKGQYQDALAMAEEAIATHPDWYYPVLLKGQANAKLGNHADAIRNFTDTMTLEPPTESIPSIRYYIAKSHMSLKDYPKAISVFTDLISQAPANRHFDLYMNRGQCEMQIAKSSEEGGNSKKASDFYSKSIVSFAKSLDSPSNARELQIEAAFQKAYAQYKIGNLEGGIQSLEKSIQAFEEVITRNPKEKRAYEMMINLGLEIVQRSNDKSKPAKYRDVVSFTNRYLEHWPNDGDVLIKKGKALQGAKNYTEAVDVFQLVVRKQPRNGDVFFSLGSCQMAAKRFPEALVSFNKALQLDQKKNPALYDYAAYCYQEQKTGCTNTDIPISKDAIAILEKGVASVDVGKQQLSEKMKRIKDNLKILQENQRTDMDNHSAAVENVRTLTAAIASNEKTLATNQELFIQQPTDELQKAIDDTKSTIRRDREKLDSEIATIKRYVTEARKCGGASVYPSFNAMVSILDQ
jgi:tetratricopeptide (TPR) repeat protein